MSDGIQWLADLDDWDVPVVLPRGVGIGEHGLRCGEQLALRVGGKPTHERVLFGQVAAGGRLVREDQGLEAAGSDSEESGPLLDRAGSVVVLHSTGFLAPVLRTAAPLRQHGHGYGEQRAAQGLHPVRGASLWVRRHGM
ncbi:hypothetical protein BX283_7811 [Streptomyces sp. TLI_146]|nr:hypothetical protein BX283_7811 [Streptomyces sp. TLI_146]